MYVPEWDHFMSDRPNISVIIPTKNRKAALGETIRTLLAQTRMADELIIVDQSQKKSLLKASPVPLKYIYNPEITGLTQARNEGMKQATGDIWLFLDDDVELEPDFIGQLLAAYGPGVTGASGIITNYSAPPIIQQIWTAIFLRGPFHDSRQTIYRDAKRLAGSAPIKVQELGGGLMSFRADEIRALRFDENLHGACFAEDIDFCARLPRNSVLLIAPQARLVHKHSPEGRNTVHWLDLNAQGANYMRQRHWRHGIWNNLCFAWLNVGYALSAILSSVRRMSLEPWGAWKRGAKRGRSLGRGMQST
jgi:glycosyltransferase involved in cell wall biosynthesis